MKKRGIERRLHFESTRKSKGIGGGLPFHNSILTESVEVALTWVKAHAFALGLTGEPSIDLLAKRDVHVHCPAGAVPKVCALLHLFEIQTSRASINEIHVLHIPLPSHKVFGYEVRLGRIPRAGFVLYILIPDNPTLSTIHFFTFLPRRPKQQCGVVYALHWLYSFQSMRSPH